MKMACLLIFLACAAFPDKIFLKSGAVVEGDIIGKSDVLIKIYVEEFQRSVAIEKENVDSVEMDGKRCTFDQLHLKQNDYNPKFKVSPRVSRPVQAAAPQAKLFDKDIFDLTRRENADSAMQDSRRMNLFFNAPARWGSLGIGYLYMPGLTGDRQRLEEFGFQYSGQSFDLRCLDLQVRRNLNGGIGSVILDMGYGKKNFTSFEAGKVYEYAIMRYLSVRYSFCKNRWLLSPGLSAGMMLSKAGITHEPASTGDSAVYEVALDDHTIRPILGLDLNFYDVVTANINVDMWNVRQKRIFAGLAFLMPFLQ